MSKLISVEFSLGVIVAIILFFLDRSGKNTAATAVPLLLFMFGLCVHAALNLPWVWSSANPAINVWRVATTICILGLAVSWFGIWTWPTRNIDEAEVANTTKLQEALIIDIYSRAPLNKGEGELTKLLLTNPTLMGNFGEQLKELMNRGIIQQTAIATKPLNAPPGTRYPLSGLPLGKDAVVLNNIFLTQKGKSLAEDFLYVRSHPKLSVFRRQE